MNKKLTISAIVLGLAIIGFLLFHIYPPLFAREPRVQTVTVYNESCGFTDPLDEKLGRNPFTGPQCSLFFVSPHLLEKPQFEGSSLRFMFNGLKGHYVVAGEGHILWNGNIVDVTKSALFINGKRIKSSASSVAINPDGSFKEGQMVTVY